MTINDIRDITSFKWATVKGTNPLSVQLDGDSAPLALIPDSLVDPLTMVIGDRVRVELSLRKAIVHGVSKAVPLRGTTTQRNARFGIPATDPERAALANKKVRWFNTDTGWEESFYAVTGLTGLTARGLITGTASGWYPTGFGPEIDMFPTTTFAATVGNYVGGWNGSVWRNGGASWFTYGTNGPALLVAGHYDLSCYTVQGAGSGLADYHMRLLNAAGSVIDWQSNFSSVPLSTTYLTAITGQWKRQPVKAGQLFRFFCSNGTLDLHSTSGPAGSGRGQMSARYVGPALVTD